MEILDQSFIINKFDKIEEKINIIIKDFMHLENENKNLSSKIDELQALLKSKEIKEKEDAKKLKQTLSELDSLIYNLKA